MTTIGWIGTGVMGVELCKHILKANYPLLVNNRTPEKAQPLLELGAQWC
jgi:3-hydroxyisobutyrate dehydrogenase